MAIEAVEFHVSRGRMALTSVGAAAFVALGIWMIIVPVRPEARFWGWVSVVFFGICFVLSFRELLWPRVKVRIDDVGIHAAMPVRGSSFEIPWSEFAGARVVVMSRQPLVIVDARDPNRGVTEGKAAQRILRKANLTLVGSWMALSPATYGVKAQDLIEAIERRRPA